jgi:oligoribonuclease
MYLDTNMPHRDAHLHYRNIDVSTIKELSKRWYPRVYFQAPKKDGGHRALADILESIEELRYYRQGVFVEGQGPTTEEAQALAQAIKTDKL